MQKWLTAHCCFGGPFCSFSNFEFFVLALTNIFTKISENVVLSFLDFIAFFYRSRKLDVSAVFLRQQGWGVFGHATRGEFQTMCYCHAAQTVPLEIPPPLRWVFRTKFLFMRVFLFLFLKILTNFVNELNLIQKCSSFVKLYEYNL